MIITVCRYIGILDTALMRPILGDHKAFGNVSDNGHQLVHTKPNLERDFIVKTFGWGSSKAASTIILKQ